jgi:hypothetical protein
MLIPITKAKEISEEFNCTKVIIYAIDSEGYEYVTTYGESKRDCLDAAEMGNDIKRLMGWPEEECHAKPDKKTLDSKR